MKTGETKFIAPGVEALTTKALEILNRIRRLQGDRTATVDESSVTNLDGMKAGCYASAVNATGRAMRRDCRTGLRRAAEDAAPTPEVSPLQRLEAFQRSEAYAADMRQFHRK